MTLKAVLFDFFDTLFLLEKMEVNYSYHPGCLHKLHNFLTNQGIKVPFEEFKKTYSIVLEELLRKAEPTLEEPHFNIRVSQTLKRLGYDHGESDSIVVGATKAFADELKKYISLDGDAKAVLRRLHGKYKVGLVSNFPMPECVRELLSEHGLKPFFDAIVISGDINRRKPRPEIFDVALRALKVAVSETVFVGDTPKLDIEGPKNMGMKAILVERSGIGKELQVKPDGIIQRLPEVPAAIESLYS